MDPPSGNPGLTRAGGCLSLLVACLGTPEAPDFRDAVVVLEEFFADFPGPVARGFPVGHTGRPNLTIPLGTWTRLDGGARRLEMLEPAVD